MNAILFTLIMALVIRTLVAVWQFGRFVWKKIGR